MTTKTNTIQARRDTSANWTTNNPVPKAGEWCFETDTGATKIGDGSTNYTSLVPVAKTTASTAELNVLDGITANTTELNYTDGVTSNIQTQLDTKVNTSAVKSSFSATPTNSNLASEKLTKDSLDLKQDVLTAGSNMIIADNIISAISSVNDTADGTEYDEPSTYAKIAALYTAATVTGIDTIKADNYTTVGSPTITDDGIVSGLSSSNLIKAPYAALDNKNFVVETPVYNITDISTTQNLIRYSDGNFRLYVQPTGKINLWVYTAPGVYPQANSNNNVVSVGHSYQFKITRSYDGTNYNHIVYIREVGVTSYSSLLTLQTQTVYYPNTQPIQLGGVDATNPFSGSIDLNLFKIYVDGSLVYQPCLKIPYKLANNGQKFADIQYKDRVADMFSQKDYAPYMLIDTTNTKWVFPYGSIDSRFANFIVVDSYRSGTSMYRKYLNRTLVQAGSCTSGTAVTFPCSTAFADTNYIVTVPYSAKTTTGFTPSQTGEYIAIGKY